MIVPSHSYCSSKNRQWNLKSEEQKFHFPAQFSSNFRSLLLKTKRFSEMSQPIVQKHILKKGAYLETMSNDTMTVSGQHNFLFAKKPCKLDQTYITPPAPQQVNPCKNIPYYRTSDVKGKLFLFQVTKRNFLIENCNLFCVSLSKNFLRRLCIMVSTL